MAIDFIVSDFDWAVRLDSQLIRRTFQLIESLVIIIVTNFNCWPHKRATNIFLTTSIKPRMWTRLKSHEQSRLSKKPLLKFKYSQNIWRILFSDEKNPFPLLERKFFVQTHLSGNIKRLWIELKKVQAFSSLHSTTKCLQIVYSFNLLLWADFFGFLLFGLEFLVHLLLIMLIHSKLFSKAKLFIKED